MIFLNIRQFSTKDLSSEYKNTSASLLTNGDGFNCHRYFMFCLLLVVDSSAGTLYADLVGEYRLP